MAFCPESSASSASAVFGKALPSPEPLRRFTSFCNIITNSRKLLPFESVTVACARVPASSVQVDATGSMMSAPIAPLFECLIGSDDERPVAPNSIAEKVATLLAFGDTSPAYHWYFSDSPGLTVCTGFEPTLTPDERVTSKKRFCGCRPTSADGRTWLALKCSTIIGSVLKPSRSRAPVFGSLL